MSTGQINFEDDILGQRIVEIAAHKSITNIVEVGTWNGLGTTRCILEGLKHKTTYNFLSFECNPEMYLQAIDNNKNKLSNNFFIHLGKLVDEDTIDNWFDHGSLIPDQVMWLREDKERMSKIPNLSFLLPEKIDFLLLDGGEFSTFYEWRLMKDRANYVVLDDTKCLKCKAIREEVLNSAEFKILEDNPDHRHGFLIFKKN